MKKMMVSMFLLLIMAAGIIHFMPNSERNVSGELGMSENIIMTAQVPDVKDTVPYYKVIKEERIHESESNIMSPKKSVPSEDEAIKIANEYLQHNDYLPEDAYRFNVQTLYVETINTSTGEDVVEREEPVLVEVSYSRRIGEFPVVGPGDTITVSLGENGKVIYFFKTWRELEQVGEMPIIDANTAIKNLQEGKTIRKSADIDYPVVEISEMEVGYFSNVSDIEQEFYKPVWIFRGTDDHGNNVTKYVNGVAK